MSRWLGVGAVWTALDEDQIDDSVEQLAAQIQMTVGEQLQDEELHEDHGDVSSMAASISEAKEELSRLRDALSSTAAVATAVSRPGTAQPALLPAGVPRLPSGFVTTDPIRQLTHLVLSTSPADLAKPRVGFFGDSYVLCLPPRSPFSSP